MDFLLDTHLVLWILIDDERLSREARELLGNKNNTFYYSVISMWEVAIKSGMGKNVPVTEAEFIHFCEQAGFKKLVFDDRHVLALNTLKQNPEYPVHRDPFDRILLSQAKADGMMLLTHDNKFKSFDEPYYRIV